MASKAFQMIVSSCQSAEAYSSLATVEVSSCCCRLQGRLRKVLQTQTFSTLSGIILQQAQEAVSIPAMKLLNNALLSSDSALQGTLLEPSATLPAGADSPLHALLMTCLVSSMCSPYRSATPEI